MKRKELESAIDELMERVEALEDAVLDLLSEDEDDEDDFDDDDC